MEINNKYTFWQKLELGIWLIRTKLIERRARLIRFPFDIRGRKFINLGKSLTTGCGCRIEAFSKDAAVILHFGNNIQINDYVHICSMQCVSIGNNVLIASHVYISDNSHGCYKGLKKDSHPDIPPANRDYTSAPVTIADNVWIGEHVVILPGVTIGKGAVIGANSVVSKNIPPYTIAVGQPAKVIKEYNTNTHMWEKI